MKEASGGAHSNIALAYSKSYPLDRGKAWTQQCCREARIATRFWHLAKDRVVLAARV